MTSLPLPSSKSLALICASHVSCVPSVDDVSDSAKFKMTSTKEGMEPVVMALTRGMVIVGEVACAVKGRAVPSRMRLDVVSLDVSLLTHIETAVDVPLHKAHPTIFAEHEVTPQRIHDHEDQLVERRLRRLAPSLSEYNAFTNFFIRCQPWHKRLIREEASREDENRDWDQEVRDHEKERSGRHYGLWTCLLAQWRFYERGNIIKTAREVMEELQPDPSGCGSRRDVSPANSGSKL
jgi:hypothetical protein